MYELTVADGEQLATHVFKVEAYVSDKDGGTSATETYNVAVSSEAYMPVVEDGLYGVIWVNGRPLDYDTDRFNPYRYNFFGNIEQTLQEPVSEATVRLDLDAGAQALMAAGHQIVIDYRVTAEDYGGSSGYNSDVSFTRTSGQDVVVGPFAPNQWINVYATPRFVGAAPPGAQPRMYAIRFETPHEQTTLETLRGMYKLFRQLADTLASRADALWDAVDDGPTRTKFVNALMDGVKQGIEAAFLDPVAAFSQSIYDWLGGSSGPGMGGGGGGDLISSALGAAGLSFSGLQDILASELGAGNAAALEKFEAAFAGLDESDPASLTTFLRDRLPDLANDPAFEGALAGLSLDSVLNQVRSSIGASFLSAAPAIALQAAAKFTPGAGWLSMAYNGVSWILNNGQEVLSKLTNGLGEFLDAATSVNTVDQATATARVKAATLTALKLAGSVAIGFAGSQLGLNKVRAGVVKALGAVKEKVEGALRKAAQNVAKALGGGTKDAKGLNGAVTRTLKFDRNNKHYELGLVATSTGVQVRVKRLGPAAGGGGDSADNGEIGKSFELTDKNFRKGEFYADPKEVREAVKAGKDYLKALKSRGKAAGGYGSNGKVSMAASGELRRAADKELKDVLKSITGGDCTHDKLSGCFAAGTLMWTPEGWLGVESLKRGDAVYSRDQHDPAGPVEVRAVEEVFRRLGSVLALGFRAGVTIRTTDEHPFFRLAAGSRAGAGAVGEWSQAAALRAGDRLLLASGECAELLSVTATGEMEEVYNCRVAEFHTYFVGGPGCKIWAHNAYEFISGRRVAEMVEAAASPIPLAQAAKDEILKLTLAEGARADEAAGIYGHGAVADLDDLVYRLKVELRGVNGSSSSSAGQVAAVDRILQTYFGFKCVREERGRLESDVQAPRIWKDYIKNTLVDSDARGVSMAEYEADMASKGLDPKTHGHHIVFKLGAARGSAKDEGRDSRDILLYYLINPYFDRANLAYAPNDGHSKKSLQYMHTQLVQAKNRIGTTKGNIHDMLRGFASDYIDRSLPGR